MTQHDITLTRKLLAAVAATESQLALNRSYGAEYDANKARHDLYVHVFDSAEAMCAELERSRADQAELKSLLSATTHALRRLTVQNIPDDWHGTAMDDHRAAAEILRRVEK